MTQLAIPALFALLIWWSSTGLILYVIALRPATYPVTTAISGLLAVAALVWLAALPAEGGVYDAYAAFCAALVVWGFVEVTFLTGFVTGPRRTPCPAGARGWRRARFATETILYHEFALVGGGLAITAASAWSGNWLGFTTFAILWIMRLSSKLNLFLGVRTLNDELLPAQLRHLSSYFQRRRLNPLFPFSITAVALAVAVAFDRAIAPGASDHSVAAHALLGSLLALALLEHLFMIMPLPVAGLWGRKPEQLDDTANAATPDATQAPRARRDRNNLSTQHAAVFAPARPPQTKAESLGGMP